MSTSINNFISALFTYPKDGKGYKTYAIVDSIKDERIKQKLLFSELKYRDLWDDELFQNEQEVPLYLIDLKKDDDLTAWLLSTHTKTSTIYLQSSYDIDVVRAHYSGYSFPYVKMQAKGYEEIIPRGIFGFYDPLIFPRFMRALYNKEKREHFFAAACLFFIPDAKEKNAWTLYYLNSDCFISHMLCNGNETILPIKRDQFYQNPKKPGYKVQTIDEIQVEIFQELAHERFVKEVLTDLTHEGLLAKADIQKVYPHILRKSIWAREHLGINTQANMARWIQIDLMLLKSPKHPIDTKKIEAIKQAKEQTQKKQILQAILREFKLKDAT